MILAIFWHYLVRNFPKNQYFQKPISLPIYIFDFKNLKTQMIVSTFDLEKNRNMLWETWLKLFSNPSKDSYLKNFQIMIDWYLSHAGCLANFSLQMLITCAILQGCPRTFCTSQSTFLPAGGWPGFNYFSTPPKIRIQ